MTYWAVNAVFLGIVAVIGLLALVVGRVRGRAARASSSPSGRGSDLVSARSPVPARRERLFGIALAVGVLLVMTAVFDNVMIGIGLVGYDVTRISGAYVGIAPLEDFAYSIAALVLLPSVWSLLGGPKTPRTVASASSRRSDRDPVEEARP